MNKRLETYDPTPKGKRTENNEMNVSDWHENVYSAKDKTDVLSGLNYTAWRLLRDEILSRDHFTCLRCGQRVRYKNHLSVHHMMPRTDGGSNDPSNLVTLCLSCHDYVEINDLRTKAGIVGSYEIAEEIAEHPAVETDWHAWVYGGARNPVLDK